MYYFYINEISGQMYYQNENVLSQFNVFYHKQISLCGIVCQRHSRNTAFDLYTCAE